MREMVGVKWLEKETFLRTVRNGLVYISNRFANK